LGLQKRNKLNVEQQTNARSSNHVHWNSGAQIRETLADFERC
jgi:hypothetical protein